MLDAERALRDFLTFIRLFLWALKYCLVFLLLDDFCESSVSSRVGISFTGSIGINSSPVLNFVISVNSNFSFPVIVFFYFAYFYYFCQV